jgi:hypothetical protein
MASSEEWLAMLKMIVRISDGLMNRVKASKFLVLLALIALAISPAWGGDSSENAPSNGNEQTKLQTDLVPQGLYESCPPVIGQPCLDNLTVIAAGGFKLVVNYAQLDGTIADELAYAAQAQSLGIQVIWDLSDRALYDGQNLVHHFKTFATSCGATDNDAVLSCYINLVKDLPATWGYYVGDEVKPVFEPKLRLLTDRLAQLDSSHPRLFVAIGDVVPKRQAYKLVPFADDAEVLGADHYPVSTGQRIGEVGQVAANVQNIDNALGRKSAVVLQSFSWGEYPDQTWVCSPMPKCAHFPTEGQMRHMRDSALKNSNPLFLLWYSYFDIQGSDHPEKHWKDLVQAAGALEGR